MKFEFKPDKLNKFFIIKSYSMALISFLRTQIRPGKMLQIDRNHVHKIKKSYMIPKKGIDTQLPIFFGPWMGELGFEILYWAPFVYHHSNKSDFSISRGGVEFLYPKCRYIDIFEYIDNSYWNKIQENRLRILGGEKQRKWIPVEIKLFREINNSLFQNSQIECAVLHPKSIFEKYKFSLVNNREFESQLGLLIDFSNSMEINNFKDQPRKQMLTNVQKVLLALYTREGVSSHTITDFYDSELFNDLTSNAEVYNLSNDYMDINHSFVSNINYKKFDCDTFYLKKNLESTVDQILRSDIVITTDGGLAYLSILLGKNTVAIRGDGEYWSEYHTLLALELSIHLNVDYKIAKLNSNNSWKLE